MPRVPPPEPVGECAGELSAHGLRHMGKEAAHPENLMAQALFLECQRKSKTDQLTATET